MTKRVLVLHSGGMDSTTCLYAAKAAGHEVLSLGIDYGQRLAVEMEFARRHCEKLDVQRDVVQVRWSKPDRDVPLNRNVADMKKSISPAFLPARNVVFLSLAVAHAAGWKAQEVQIGLNCVEFSGYPDCTAEFLDSCKALFAVAYPDGPEIVAPLLHMSKPEIARLAKDHGLGEHDTWSCYKPQLSGGAMMPCQECDACVLHAHAWAGVATA